MTVGRGLPRDPITAAARLAGRRGRVLLHSGRDDDGCGHWSFVACEPARTLQAIGREITIRGADGATVSYAVHTGGRWEVQDFLRSSEILLKRRPSHSVPTMDDTFVPFMEEF